MQPTGALRNKHLVLAFLVQLNETDGENLSNIIPQIRSVIVDKYMTWLTLVYVEISAILVRSVSWRQISRGHLVIESIPSVQSANSSSLLDTSDGEEIMHEKPIFGF